MTILLSLIRRFRITDPPIRALHNVLWGLANGVSDTKDLGYEVMEKMRNKSLLFVKMSLRV